MSEARALLAMVVLSLGPALGCESGGAPVRGETSAPGAGGGAPDTSFDGSSACASGQRWSGGVDEGDDGPDDDGAGDEGSDDEGSGERRPREREGSMDMAPGRACIACHAHGEGPDFSIAGTVFPSGHVPDDCLPTDAEAANLAQASVVITGADGQAVTLPVTPNGNFAWSDAWSGAVAFPITAKVVYQGKERRMLAPQPSGDCNGCHTEQGRSGAPGRIALPR